MFYLQCVPKLKINKSKAFNMKVSFNTISKTNFHFAVTSIFQIHLIQLHLAALLVLQANIVAILHGK